MAVPGGLDTRSGRFLLGDGKFVIQTKLFGQGFAQVIVIINQQDSAFCHCIPHNH